MGGSGEEKNCNDIVFAIRGDPQAIPDTELTHHKRQEKYFVMF
jgi:hypothetical protein